MLNEDYFLSKNWMCSKETYEEAKWVMLGLPFDSTCSNRPGTRFASNEIRYASYGLEEYSPIFNRELESTSFYDAGDLNLPFGNPENALSIIKNCANDIINDDKFVFGIGGEHLVSLPLIQVAYKKYPNMLLVHFDAHADLRHQYLGQKLSHASVIRRALDSISTNKLIQIGIRSGEKDEFGFMKEHNTLCQTNDEIVKKLNEHGLDIPIYLTIDLDVLDPSIFPGTGTPEPGGMTYKELIEKILLFKNKNVIGIDVVELSPHYDASGVSTAVAAKVIRELLLEFA